MAITVRNAVIVCLGGTGLKTGIWAKKLFLDRLERVPERVRIVCFDTDDERLRNNISLQSGGPVSLVDEEEFVQTIFEVKDVVSTLRQRPRIAAWFPREEMHPISEHMTNRVRRGVPGRLRKLGRLGLFLDIQRIYGRLQSVARLVTSDDAKRQDEEHGFLPAADQGGGIDWFFVFSCCGGTGSGMSLDMAFLARERIRRELPDQYTAFMVLPSAFDGDLAEKPSEMRCLQANAFAYIKELDYFMNSGSGYSCTYDSGSNVRVVVSQKPFDYVYPVDRLNEDNLGARGVDKLARLIAEAVYLQACNPTDEQAQAALVAGVPYLRLQVQGKFSSYSSLGVSYLQLPSDNLATYCNGRLGGDILSHLLSTADTAHPTNPQAEREARATLDAAVAAALQDFFAQHRDIKAWEGSLALDEYGQPLGLPTPRSRLLSLGRHSLVTELVNVRTVHTSLTLPAHRRTVESNQQALAETLKGAINTAANRQLDDPSKGAPYTKLLLGALTASLEQYQAALRDRQAGLRGTRGEDEGKELPGDADLAALRRLAAGFLSWHFRKAARRQVIGKFLDAVDQWLNDQLQDAQLEATSQLLVAVRTHVTGLQDEIDQLISRVAAVRDALQGEAGNTLSSKDTDVEIYEISVLKDVHFESLYAERVPDISAKIKEFFQAPGTPRMSDWRGREAAQIKRWLSNYTKPLFADLAAMTLDDAIRRTGQDPAALLRELTEKAVPRFSYTKRALAGEDLADEIPYSIRVLGVGDRNASLLGQAAGAGISQASTGDLRSVVFYHTKHGFPIRAYAGLEDLRHSYCAVLGHKVAGITWTLHLDPSLEVVPDPVGTDRNGFPYVSFDEFCLAVGGGIIALDNRGNAVLKGPGAAEADGSGLGLDYEGAWRKLNASESEGMLRVMREHLAQFEKQDGRAECYQSTIAALEKRAERSPLSPFSLLVLTRLKVEADGML